MSIKVLIASESAFRRTMIAEMLSSNENINVVNIARNYDESFALIQKHTPEILVLDIQLENIEWFIPFYKIFEKELVHIIILTDINPQMVNSHEIPTILKSNDYIIKPHGVWKEELPKIKDNLISKILLVGVSKQHKMSNKIGLTTKNRVIHENQKSLIQIRTKPKGVLQKLEEQRFEEYFLELLPLTSVKLDTKIIVIGASIGGPRTLRTIFNEVPRGFPAPILVVQHLNHLFMRQFATSLRNMCKVKVKIGMNYEELYPGIIYISPGDKHMQVTVKNNKPCIRTFEGEPVNFCRPSVDILFYSTARVYKEKCLGILLTGMGSDGVKGLKAIKSEGGKTIAESEETSILYGMPKVAAETGVAELIVPNYRIIDEMIKFVN